MWNKYIEKNRAIRGSAIPEISLSFHTVNLRMQYTKTNHLQNRVDREVPVQSHLEKKCKFPKKLLYYVNSFWYTIYIVTNNQISERG